MPARTTQATVDLTQNDEGLWLTVRHGSRTATILLNIANSGPLIGDTVRAWADNCFRQPPLTTMKRLLAITTGAVALAVVAAAAGSAVTYAVTHGFETLANLGNSALSGIGMAIGGCLGSALVLRFKTARRYLHSILKDLRQP